FNWYYMVYGIFTAGQRTWGGPRADAAAADQHTTVQEAIEHAEKTGDDLNIVPESFIPAAVAQKGDRKTGKNGPLIRARGKLQPPDKVDGIFAAPERTASGWYLYPAESMDSVSAVGGSSIFGDKYSSLQHRDSFDSALSAQTAGNSVYIPRRVESIMGGEDR